MPRIIATEASLYNGISQQNPELRLPSQLEDAENVSLTVSRGVEKRPPVEVVAKYSGRYTDTSLVHPIDYAAGESYMLVIPGPGSTIGTAAYDMEGLQYPVVFTGSSATYYNTVNPSTGQRTPIEDISLTSVLDYTFLTNKNVLTAFTNAPDADLINVGYLFVKNGVQEVAREVQLGIYTGTVGKHANNDSEYVVDQMIISLNGAGANADYTITKVSKSVIKFERLDGATFDLTATDSYGDTTMDVAQSWNCTLDVLPPVATNGQIMCITSTNAADNEYYLKFNETAKEWFEEQAPGEDHNWDLDTMPHAFIKKVDDGVGTITGTPDQIYFSLESLAYTARTSGGEDASPSPSFKGKSITDVFFFKNRLGFISEDNVILSATDDIFRFWPTTVKEVLEDDPIDIAISSNSNVKLYHAATFPDSLIIIGDKQQFSLNSGSKSFTAENVVLNPTTSYPASPTVPPTVIGASLYFTAPQNTFTSVREYSVQPDTLVTDAADITAHVPKLLENNVKQLVSESNQEFLFLFNTDSWQEGSRNQVSVYKFYWQGNDKVQSSWFNWYMWFNPLGGITYDGHLYMIGTERFNNVDDHTVITKVDLRDKPIEFESEPGRPYKSSRPYLDRVDLVADTTPTGCTGKVQITAEQYQEISTLKGVTFVLMDRISGEVFTIRDVGLINGEYFIIIDCNENGGAPQPDVDDPDCLTIGLYTLGGGCEDN